MNNKILLLAITVFCLYVIANMLTFGVFLGLGYVVATVITAFVMYCVIKALELLLK